MVVIKKQLSNESSEGLDEILNDFDKEEFYTHSDEEEMGGSDLDENAVTPGEDEEEKEGEGDSEESDIDEVDDDEPDGEENTVE